jgi:hypothetical protein
MGYILVRSKPLMVTHFMDRLSSHVMEIIEKGGIIPMIREKLGRE